MNNEDLAGRASLRKRFPGIDGQINRAVGEAADYLVGKRAFRVYADVLPVLTPGSSIATGWTVFVVAYGPAVRAITPNGEIRMPVIPDQYAKVPGAAIKATDEPWQFRSMSEAERYGAEAVGIMEAQLRALVTATAGAPTP